MPSQSVDGAAAVGIQIDGDGNIINLGSTACAPKLDRPHRRRGLQAPTNERQLLLTEWRATTLVGRKAELENLRSWLDSDRLYAVRCMTGRAGSGKSRLAIEACEDAEKAGWVAGFLPSDELRRATEDRSLNQWVPAEPTLVVIDDAGIVAPLLKDWFAALAKSAGEEPKAKLRILLLERYADPHADVGWWAELKRPRSLTQADASDLIGDETPIPLATIIGIEDRRALLSEAMALAARILGQPVLQPPPLGANSDFDRRLADDRLENEPLFLLMAGIVAAQHGAAEALAIGRVELAGEIASLERTRLARLGESRGLPSDGKLIAHLAACVTLQRGCPLSEAGKLIADEMAAIPLQCSIGLEDLVDLLAEALPSADGTEIDRVRPDLIGEAFFLREIQGPRLRTDAERLEIINRARQRHQPRVLKSLVLAAQDFAAGVAGQRVVGWLTEIGQTSESLPELMKIADALPFNTVALREVGAFIDKRIVDLAGDDTSLRALSLSKLAVRLAALGQRAQARTSAQEAAELFRSLSEEGTSHPLLAATLNNLATLLCTDGAWEDAIEVAVEAVRLNRAREDSSSRGSRAKLATSLNTAARAYRGIGEIRQALQSGMEASQLRESLAAEDPETFTPAYAKSLNSMAVLLSDVGSREHSLAAARKAVDLYRGLAATQPDAYSPEFALALATLADVLRADGQVKAALEAGLESLRLRRALAENRPDAFNSALAVSLASLANTLLLDGQSDAALSYAEEALGIFQILAATTPGAVDQFLASNFSIRSRIFETQGRFADAAESARMAVVSLFPVFDRFPAAHGRRMRSFLERYLERAEAAGSEIDRDWVQSIFGKLDREEVKDDG